MRNTEDHNRAVNGRIPEAGTDGGEKVLLKIGY
jgi:hypothetical protein